LGEEKPGEVPVEKPVSQEIDIDLIDPNPEQPRTSFTEATLEELTQSIRANGVVQPIVLRQVGGRYQIVACERRWRASQRAGLRKIPAAIREVSDEKLLELALIENIQRQELNPIEEALAYRKLIDTLGLTQESVAERVGKDRGVQRLQRVRIRRHGVSSPQPTCGALASKVTRALPPVVWSARGSGDRTDYST
jgi:ParB family chromosome partitioning protein